MSPAEFKLLERSLMLATAAARGLPDLAAEALAGARAAVGESSGIVLTPPF